ncbi:MAG: diguanylate cyclase [Cyanobacteria bacterium J06649_4]
MFKRPFQVVSSSPNWVSTQAAAGSAAISYPQPIEEGDKQRLIKLADPQDKVCVSGWSSHDAPDNSEVHHHQPAKPQCLDGTAPSVPMPNTVASAQARIRQLNQHIHQQQRLRQVERKLRQSLDFSSILGTAVVEAAALFGAAHTSLLRYHSQSQSFEQVARYCANESLAWDPPLSLSLAAFPQFCQQLWQGKALHVFPEQLRWRHSSARTAFVSSAPSALSSHETGSRETVESNQSLKDEHSPRKAFDHESRQWLAQCSGSWLIVPIENSSSADSVEAQGVDSCWGVMALALPSREVWTESAIAAVQSLSTELTLVMGQSRQYQELLVANRELQKLALSDGLTSLANRRRFDEHLSDEWNRLARDKRPLSLILCDLDHFKRYNDAFGHPAGDRCLIRVARALLSGPQRPADLVARYGGEEFAIILPNTDTHGAWRIAQKIHESIRALQMPHAPETEEPYVTVTMGVSTIIPGHDNTPQMLLQASDLALYYAKQQGRNRTYVNGHYNTMKEEIAEGRQGVAQPDVLPLSPSE